MIFLSHLMIENLQLSMNPFNCRVQEVLSRDNPLVSSSNASTDEERFVARLVDATEQATKIYFRNVDKKWLRANVWHYTSEVITKALKFNMNFTVDLMVTD